MSSDIPLAAYITTAELARRLGVHPATVSRWCKAGTIPHLRAGGVLRFDWSEVLRRVRSQAQSFADDALRTTGSQS